MHVLKNQRVQAGTVLFLLALVVFCVGSYARSRQLQQKGQESVLPPDGAMQNDTKGKVPGDPKNAVADLERLYKVLRTYQNRYDGRYPSTMMEVSNELWLYPQSYGFSDAREASFVLHNPDSKYADAEPARRFPKTFVPYYIPKTRPDGSAIGDPKPTGTRDVLVLTRLYYHENRRVFSGHRSTSNPVGFYIVLWDNGQVEKVSYDQVLYVPQGSYVPRGSSSFTNAFPGQAGVPKNFLSYDSFYKRFGYKQGPRGVAGGKGESYNGQSYR